MTFHFCISTNKIHKHCDKVIFHKWNTQLLELHRLSTESSSVVRPGDMCTALGIISLSPLSLATGVTDATFGASGIWLGTRIGVSGTATLAWSFFWLQPMAPWRAGTIPVILLIRNEVQKHCKFGRVFK